VSKGDKGDFEDFGPSGLNPLDGDLLGAMGPAEPAGLEPMGQPEGIQETVELPPEPSTEEPPQEQVREEEVKAPKGPGFLARLAESNPYTVMLVVSLAALLIGVLCLLLELGSYGFDIKAKSVRQSANAAAPANLTVASAATIDIPTC
jgi:hypothetical protein